MACILLINQVFSLMCSVCPSHTQVVFLPTSLARMCHACVTFLTFSGDAHPAFQLFLDLHFEKLNEIVLCAMLEQVRVERHVGLFSRVLCFSLHSNAALGSIASCF